MEETEGLRLRLDAISDASGTVGVVDLHPGSHAGYG